ncbi:DUF6461 domain-containing protein [Streptomyces sp. NEAU-Y11]|uniref:DUF6461 domain-containing protein n=1 Tax=Streptomyces cucumeris TaxID=2962890 RepID=UPI0020C844CB|nr:DUF6461 domain-containing protein [Streptomyces sp. NEAU-Y11]MCP9213386.1 DUF6461 domain-containing protein [Streptomyces sp. NEAU-Y11]
MMSIDHDDAWQWATDPRTPTFCITFTRGATPQDVIAAYGADPTQATVLTPAQAIEAFPAGTAGTVLRVGALGRWSFCYENREPEGFKPAVLHRLSHATETIQVFKGGDGMNGIERLQAGHTTERFEPGMATAHGDGPHLLFDQAQRLTAAQPPHTPALHTALRAVGQYIGADLHTATLNGPLLTAFVADGHRSPRTPVSAPGQRPARSLGRNLGPVELPPRESPAPS